MGSGPGMAKYTWGLSVSITSDIKVCLDILSDHDFHANGYFNLV